MIRRHIITVTTVGGDLRNLTISLKGLLKNYFSNNPKLLKASVDPDPRGGTITVEGLETEELKEYVNKACLQISTARGIRVNCKVSEETPAEPTPTPTKSQKTKTKTASVVFSAPTSDYSGIWHYKLLISREVMKKLKEIQMDRKPLVAKILRALASGEWEKWSTKSTPNFSAWREEENHHTLYTLVLEDLGILVYERATSVDLLGRVVYPAGAYYDSPPIPNTFAPHVVILSILPLNAIRAFRLSYRAKLYKEEPGVNEDAPTSTSEPSDEIAYTEELYLLSPNRVEDFLSGEQIGLPLHLSEEQIAVFGVQGPVLLSGEAGSGKTSVITQWLVINHLRQRGIDPTVDPLSQLFVTFSELLRDHTRESFETMLPKTCRKNNTQFKTYRELLLNTVEMAGLGDRFQPSKEMSFERFMREYAPKLAPKPQIDAVLLWDEIRSVIKGSGTGEDEIFIDFDRYSKLSESKGHCKTPSHLREDYYNAAERYQSYVFREGLWDGIDLVRTCLREIAVAPKFEKIACDEVQDLSPIEISLLFKLLKRKDISDIFLTGDIAQVINPSGFQWPRLKYDLGREFPGRKIPEVNYLRRNYRSCSEIVELVNRVLVFRRDLLNDEVSKVEQTPLLPSRVKPMVLRSPPTEDLTSLESNPKLRLILTKTAQEREKVENLLGKAGERVTILSIEQAKGLEYDGVLLWNFFLPRHETITKSDWEQVFVPERRQHLKESIALNEKNPYALTYEFNLLHVGLTRARQLLWIYDEDPKMRIANLGDDIAQSLTPADPADFKIHWETEAPSPSDLFEAGDRLRNRDTDQSNRLFMLAGVAFENIGNIEKAAECFENGRDFERSSKSFKAVGDTQNELRVLVMFHESHSRWVDAARLSEDRGKLLIGQGLSREASAAYDKALLLFKKVSDKQAMARCAIMAADSIDVRQHEDRALKFSKAAYWAKEAGNHEASVSALTTAISEAQRVKQDGKSDKLGELPEDWIAGRYKELAEHQESLGEFSEAASSAMKAAGLWKSLAENPEAVPSRAHFNDRHAESLSLTVRCYIRAGEISQAAHRQHELSRFYTDSYKGGTEEAIDRWSSFASFYLDHKEYDQYVETMLELTSILDGRKEYGLALVQLNESAKRCEELGLGRLVLRLAEKRVDAANRTKEPGKIANAYYSLAEAQMQEGESRRGLDSLHRAAITYLETRDSAQAAQALEKAVRLASQIMSPTEVGWFCMKEVGIDVFATRGDYSSATNWIQHSSVYFVQDAPQSVARMHKLWADQDKEVARLSEQMRSAESRSRKDELQTSRNRNLVIRGLAEVAFFALYSSLASVSGDEKNKMEAKSWSEKAIESLREAGDLDAVREAEAMARSLH